MPPAIDLRPEHFEIIRTILRRHVPQYEVWAYGSRTRGTARRFSDLDLAVITDQPMSLAVSGALAEDFRESDLPFRVDVLDWASASASFRGIVERQRVPLLPAATSEEAVGDRAEPGGEGDA